MIQLSIIIPVYNVEEYVEKCIRSCAEQSVSPETYEIIVINDGTRDNSLEVVERVSKDYSNIIIHSQKNAGLSAARNKGISLAKGEYIWFVDSDDWIRSDSLKVIFKQIENSQAEIISFMGVEYYEESDTYRNLQIAPTGIYGSTDFIEILLSNRTSSHICFRVFKTELFDNTKFPVGVVYEDALTFPYLVSNSNKIAQINEGLYFYLQRAGSITESKPKNVNGLINEMERLSEFLIVEKNIREDLIRKFSSALYLTIAVTLVKFADEFNSIKSDLKLVLGYINAKKLFFDKLRYRPSDSAKTLLLKLSPNLLYLIYKVNKKRTQNYES